MQLGTRKKKTKEGEEDERRQRSINYGVLVGAMSLSWEPGGKQLWFAGT